MNLDDGIWFKEFPPRDLQYFTFFNSTIGGLTELEALDN